MKNALARLLAAVHDDGVVGQVSLPRDVARSRVEAADELAPVVGDLSETSRDVERREKIRSASRST
jgi:hypothetical protein